MPGNADFIQEVVHMLEAGERLSRRSRPPQGAVDKM